MKTFQHFTHSLHPKNSLATMKIVYTHGVIFREVTSTHKHEDELREGEPKKIEFDLENGESNSTDEDESNKSDEEEIPQTLTLRRSI
jgi:hypothetical protein